MGDNITTEKILADMTPTTTMTTTLMTAGKCSNYDRRDFQQPTTSLEPTCVQDFLGIDPHVSQGNMDVAADADTTV